MRENSILSHAGETRARGGGSGPCVLDLRNRVCRKDGKEDLAAVDVQEQTWDNAVVRGRKQGAKAPGTGIGTRTAIRRKKERKNGSASCRVGRGRGKWGCSKQARRSEQTSSGYGESTCGFTICRRLSKQEKRERKKRGLAAKNKYPRTWDGEEEEA